MTETTKKTFRFEARLSLVSIKEDGLFVMQCLEWDIAAQGATEKEAFEAWKRAFSTQVILDLQESRKPLEDIAPAPSFYWKLSADTEAEDADEFSEFADADADVPPPWILQAHTKIFRPGVVGTRRPKPVPNSRTP